MKKIGIILLTIIVIGLGVYTFHLNNELNTQKTEKENLKSQIQTQTEQIENLQSTIENVRKTVESEDEENEEDNYANENTKEVKFDSDKLKIKDDDMEYRIAEKYDAKVFKIDAKDGKAYITTFPDVDEYQYFYNNKSALNSQLLNGFKTDVKDVYFDICGGQEITDYIIFFLMEDGTVEYMKPKEIIDNNKFKSEGTIDELENIVKFETVAASDDDGGYVTVVAIDEDGYSYDLNKIINNDY